MTMSTRIGVMRAGAIEQIGTPGEIYEAPASRFVADFVGTINLFEAHVVRVEGERAVLAAPELGAELVAARALAPGAAVALGVRPEKLELSHQPLMPNLNRLTGVIRDVAYLGGQSSYHVALDGGGPVLRVTLPNLDRRAGGRFAAGDRVHVGWRPEAGVVLEA
jgi:putrescine transport system ATP-binding protein